jgi:hypothetical protein
LHIQLTNSSFRNFGSGDPRLALSLVVLEVHLEPGLPVRISAV